jgi:hypothetical protein
MNTARRKQLKQAAELLSQAQAIIESVRDDEQYEYHNMPESLQYSERGERMYENVAALDTMLEDIAGLFDNIDELTEQ